MSLIDLNCKRTPNAQLVDPVVPACVRPAVRQYIHDAIWSIQGVQEETAPEEEEYVPAGHKTHEELEVKKYEPAAQKV